MDKKEVAILLGILKIAYPRFYSDMNNDDKKRVVELWTDMLSDIDLETGKLALHKLISTSAYPPTIADVRKAISETSLERLKDAGEAWGEVISAIQKYGYNRPKEAFADMSNITQLTVKNVGWVNLCMSENAVADRAHFIKIYQTIEKREKEKQLIPLAVQEKILLNIESNKNKDKTHYLKLAK